MTAFERYLILLNGMHTWIVRTVRFETFLQFLNFIMCAVICICVYKIFQILSFVRALDWTLSVFFFHKCRNFDKSTQKAI